MSFATALKLSFTNIKTKKGRTALTAFASSIGIVGIATIMSLSSGFQEQITKFQSDSFASFPIMITQENSQIDIEEMQERQKELMGVTTSEDSYPDTNEVFYTDLADQIMSMTDGIMTGITVVLIAFAGISLVVSLIMIGIITYTSVLERTKEIGILKALGASKKDITRVFDAETCILGIFSGVLGICIAYGLTFPINSIIYKMTDLENVAQLPIIYAIILVAISTI